MKNEGMKKGAATEALSEAHPTKMIAREWIWLRAGYFPALLLSSGTAWAQVDTTDAGYKIGYEIGSWLPFIILAGLFMLMLVQARRRSERKEE